MRGLILCAVMAVALAARGGSISFVSATRPVIEADAPSSSGLNAVYVADGVAERGVLVCGTGIGMAMAADKVPGVRAANIINSEFAALCREHNDANVIALSGRLK